MIDAATGAPVIVAARPESTATPPSPSPWTVTLRLLKYAIVVGFGLLIGAILGGVGLLASGLVGLC